MAIYYISDLHLGHENAIKFDNRPFANIKEMHDTILDNWNSRVTGKDIRIYQINMGRDAERKAFQSLDNLKHLFGNENIDASLYDKVFEGEVDCDSLESVYQMFNLNHPDGYRGRSLSVSDVVEVVTPPKIVGEIETNIGNHSYTDIADYISAQDNYREMDMDFTAHDYVGPDKYLFEPGFYFCDSVGFQRVEFDAEQAQNVMKPATIKVVLLELGKMARVAEIDSSLDGLQKVVGGDIPLQILKSPRTAMVSGLFLSVCFFGFDCFCNNRLVHSLGK